MKGSWNEKWGSFGVKGLVIFLGCSHLRGLIPLWINSPQKNLNKNDYQKLSNNYIFKVRKKYSWFYAKYCIIIISEVIQLQEIFLKIYSCLSKLFQKCCWFSIFSTGLHKIVIRGIQDKLLTVRQKGGSRFLSIRQIIKKAIWHSSISQVLAL